MRFTELKIGDKFSLPRENNAYIYIKLNENKHNNASTGGIVYTLHGCTQVKEIK